jgi:signal transduction histidine kinase
MTATAIYGVLVICSRENGGFTPLKTDILTLFANQATVALHNAVLLDTTRQRNRFQQAVEQLEQTLHHEDSEFTPELERAELELLRQVRGEMQRTFGISLGNLLQRMGRHMTTLHERDPEAYAVIHASQEEFFASPATSQSVYPLALPMGELEQQLQVTSDENQALLERAADAALSNAAMLGELSRLIMQLEHSTNWVRDAWLVVDLSGTCRYMNPAAQRLCGVNLEQVSTSYNGGLLELPQGQISAYQLTDVFARLLPRIRNREEVHSYLEAFTRECDGVYGLRCVLAEEPCDAQTIEQERASDHYYKLTRYPLYTQQGAQLEAGALQIQDVTEQVRDERNRSALFSAVSHDLRTPLTTIKAAVTGLLEPDMPWEEQERREVLEEIDSEADRLTVMVTSLVELSRIEVGALNLKKEWCDVAEVFHGIWPRIRRVLANRQLGTQFQEPLPLIYADHAQLGSVLFYLIENAARHSPDHSTIVVDMHVIVEDTTEKLRIQVIDHGIEIPEHEREKVFTAFHMQEQNYGNGLSLTICKRIVEAHQGKIWVESTNGGGSCFVFTLPIHSHSLVHMGEKVPVRIEGDAGSKVRGK